MAITANKIPGIRAAVAHDAMTARLARDHNDANVLALGGRVVDDPGAIEIVRDFLNACFAGPAAHRRDCGTRPGTGAEVTSAMAVQR
jgi:ribose 5-phosphate isomerase B